LYFGNGVSVYYNGGVLKGEPSAVVEVKGKTLSGLRRGRIPEKVLQELLKT
jgi:tRNA A37 threonylcarbamoyladenosine synthetase subunit TsaC/SUA5/YrdC